MECPYCGFKFRAKKREICINCGKPLPQKKLSLFSLKPIEEAPPIKPATRKHRPFKKCPLCSYENPVHQRFCKKCNFDFTAAAMEETEKKKKFLFTLLVGVGGGGALLIIILWLFWFFISFLFFSSPWVK